MADAVGLAWQGSLLATGEVSVDRSFADLRRHELAVAAPVVVAVFLSLESDHLAHGVGEQHVGHC